MNLLNEKTRGETSGLIVENEEFTGLSAGIITLSLSRRAGVIQFLPSIRD